MIGDNGHEPTGTPVAASLRQPTIQRRKASTLSSIERSALLDELVDQLIALKRTVTEQRAIIDAMNATWQQMQLQQNARLDQHANVVLRTRLRDRLRWLLVGV